ncbi:MAG: hypothetical protein HYX48_02845 [Chlamydiales bacterium]|nr:hypothetical protein [Chlamydiales bacterium]
MSMTTGAVSTASTPFQQVVVETLEVQGRAIRGVRDELRLSDQVNNTRLDTLNKQVEELTVFAKTAKAVGFLIGCLFCTKQMIK